MNPSTRPSRRAGGPQAPGLPLAVLLAALALPGCPAPEGPAAGASTDHGDAAPASADTAAPRKEWALAIHGGAGVRREDVSDEELPAYMESLARALELGKGMLAEGRSSLDVVEAVVRNLEDDPLFNAGRGAVFTASGTNELDAAIMDGRDLSCGTVAGLKTVKNPITLARKVMEESRHVFLIGDGAETFADEVGIERVEPGYFFVQRRFDSWQRDVEREKAEEAQKPAASDGTRGTVGAVALDRDGNLAAATSTGGTTNKRFGRVGDVPVIGAGTFASNASAGVSCTGWGEQFIRHTVARNVAALMEYKGLDLDAAVAEMIDGQLDPDDGGLIAVGKDGSITLAFNTEGMYRGAVDSEGRFETGVWK